MYSFWCRKGPCRAWADTFPSTALLCEDHQPLQIWCLPEACASCGGDPIPKESTCCSTAFTQCVDLAILESCLAEVGLLSKSYSSFGFVLHCRCCSLLADSGQSALSKSLELKFSHCVFVLKVYACSKNCLFYYSQWYSPAQVPEGLLALYLSQLFLFRKLYLFI